MRPMSDDGLNFGVSDDGLNLGMSDGRIVNTERFRDDDTLGEANTE